MMTGQHKTNFYSLVSVIQVYEWMKTVSPSHLDILVLNVIHFSLRAILEMARKDCTTF